MYLCVCVLRSGQYTGAAVFSRAASWWHQCSQSSGARLRAAGVPVLPRVRPPAAEGPPPQTPAAGAQAGHRRRQTHRRPPKVWSVTAGCWIILLHAAGEVTLMLFWCVSCFLRYMLYWRGRFLEQPVTDFCSVIKTNSTGPVGESTELLLRNLTTNDTHKQFPSTAADVQ